jgi:hypothetical protein
MDPDRREPDAGEVMKLERKPASFEEAFEQPPLRKSALRAYA